MLLHQTQCEKISNKRFKKDLQKVWALTQDANGNNYKMHDILMIDDSPDKFDRFKDHVIIFQTLIHDEKESQLLCDKQYSFLKCLIKNMASRKNEESAVHCLETTFAECSNNPYVNRCDSSIQGAEVASKSHGISGSAGIGHNDFGENVASIDPKSIANAGKIDQKNIIHGESIHSESSITLREQ